MTKRALFRSQRPGRNPWRRAMATLMAGVAGTAVGLVAGPILSSPAGATTAISTITTDSGTAPTATTPQPHANAKVGVIASAVDPVNGDVAELANTDQIFLVVNKSGEAATDFGIGTSGTLVQGDVYLIAGKGTQGWPTPIVDGTTKATSVPIGNPATVTFDSNGNLLWAGRTTGRTYVEVDPATTGKYYGFTSTMNPGDVYYLAGFSSTAAQNPPAPGIKLASALTIESLTASSGLVSGGVQNVAFSTSTSILLLNFSSSTQHLYGTAETSGQATQFAGGGSTKCISGPQTVTVANLTLTAPYLYADSSGNLYVANKNGPCTWVLPAANGTIKVDGVTTAVATGSAYKVAGDGTFPFTSPPTDGSPATSTSVGCVDNITQDLAGNLLLAANCGPTTVTTNNGISVIANSTGTFYGQSMTAGDVYTVAGAVPPGPTHDLTTFTAIASVGVDSAGDIFTTDAGAHKLYEITGGPAKLTSVSLTVTPAGHATHGTTETLTAKVTPATVPGTVAFKNGTTTLGKTAVSGGTASIMLTLTTGTYTLTAVFTSTTSAYGGSTSAPVSYKVTAFVTPYTTTAKTSTTQTVTITVTVPQEGIFELTVPATARTVKLSKPALTHTNHTVLTSTGTIHGVVLTTTVNSETGWTVTGRVSTFTGNTASHRIIPGKDLGWVPHASATPTNGATAGPTVAPGATPGLHTPGSLWAKATATHGRGTTDLSATFTMKFPETTHPALYKATFTVTAVR